MEKISERILFENKIENIFQGEAKAHPEENISWGELKDQLSQRYQWKP